MISYFGPPGGGSFRIVRLACCLSAARSSCKGVGVNPVPLQSKLAVVTAFSVMFTEEMEIDVARQVLLQKESSGGDKKHRPVSYM